MPRTGQHVLLAAAIAGPFTCGKVCSTLESSNECSKRQYNNVNLCHQKPSGATFAPSQSTADNSDQPQPYNSTLVYTCPNNCNKISFVCTDIIGSDGKYWKFQLQSGSPESCAAASSCASTTTSTSTSTVSSTTSTISPPRLLLQLHDECTKFNHNNIDNFATHDYFSNYDDECTKFNHNNFEDYDRYTKYSHHYPYRFLYEYKIFRK